MGADVVLGEWLLDQQQVVIVESPQVIEVEQRVRGVRVDLEQGIRCQKFAHRGHRLEVPPGFDLELDAAIALGNVESDLVEQRGDRRGDAHRDAAVHLGALGPEVTGKAGVCGAQLCIEHGRFDDGLGHPMPDHEREESGDTLGRDVVGREKRRRKVVADHVFAAVDVFARIDRIGARDAFSPAVTDIRSHAHQQHLAPGLATERGLEGAHKRNGHAMQFDRQNFHGSALRKRAFGPRGPTTGRSRRRLRGGP